MNSVDQYRATQINAAPREKVMMLLFDGAVNYSNIALDKLQKGDLAGKGVYIGKAQAIITEMLRTLDHTVGGDISIKLEQLYHYINFEYNNANMSADVKSLSNAIKILSEIRSTFAEAVDLYHGQEPQIGVRS